MENDEYDFQRDLVSGAALYAVMAWCVERAERSEALAADPARDAVKAAMDGARALTLREVVDELAQATGQKRKAA